MTHLRNLAMLLAIALPVLSRSNATAPGQLMFSVQGFESGNCNAGLQNIDGGYCYGGSATCKINGQTAYDSQANCQSHGTAGILKRTL